MMAYKEPEVKNVEKVEEMFDAFRKIFEEISPYEVRADYRVAFKIWADKFIDANN